ncbi:MAG: L-serine ammonia-lyase [Erysipelotrichaceae bacterium]|nr:L-serine ammonia-lyase [Erysipelotrichaceae bacterium]
MQAIRELYKVGRGPSSSHTLAPERACRLFVQIFGKYPYYEAELFGSLSLTGKGHRTDGVIEDTLPGKTDVIFSADWDEEFPNGFYLRAFDGEHVLQHSWTVFSTGGGSIRIKEFPVPFNDEVYEEKSFSEIRALLKKEHLNIPDYLYRKEPGLQEYLRHIVHAEIQCVEQGLAAKGMLPGKLQMKRSAHDLYRTALSANVAERQRLQMMSYAYAASEENADGKTVVTAPTLGACGVIASMVYHYYNDLHYDDTMLADALAVGGLFGNLVKTNATISGAVGGCQAEVGTAVSMASAAIAFLDGQTIDQIEYAAEIGMEHNLGLTCDPVMGYVMIPCIERNAVGILRAMDCALLSRTMSMIKPHRISFDMVVDTMNETGKQIPITLKETSAGGLALEYEEAANEQNQSSL